MCIFYAIPLLICRVFDVLPYKCLIFGLPLIQQVYTCMNTIRGITRGVQGEGAIASPLHFFLELQHYYIVVH